MLSEPIGDAYWFTWNEVLDAAREEAMNIDRFLTCRLSLFLTKKKPKSNILIFYTPTQDRFVVTVCSRRRVNFLDVLHSTAGMPGYMEYGQDYVPVTARPFLYYGGMEIFRVYDVDNPKPGAFYVSDFGNLFGLTTFTVSKDDYVRIKTDVQSHVEYSVVPQLPTEEVKHLGVSVLLQHAFCRTYR